jgi:hypothetical protein
MKFFKNQTVGGYLVDAATLLSFLGVIFYIITGTSGFLAGNAVDPWPIILSLLGVAIGVVLFLFAPKLPSWAIDVLLGALLIALSASFCLFIYDRLTLFADVWFIPVNYPAAEKTWLGVSLIGIIFQIMSVIALIVAGFMDKLVKAE